MSQHQGPPGSGVGPPPGPYPPPTGPPLGGAPPYSVQSQPQPTQQPPQMMSSAGPYMVPPPAQQQQQPGQQGMLRAPVPATLSSPLSVTPRGAPVQLVPAAPAGSAALKRGGSVTVTTMMPSHQQPPQRYASYAPASALPGPAAAAAAASARSRKRKFGDKIIPPEVRELVPESQAYMDLLNFEKKLDATIARKKLDIQEALKRPTKVKRRLRIYVSHTYYPSKEAQKEGEESSVPMWELRVEGRLLDDIALAQQPNAGGGGGGAPGGSGGAQAVGGAQQVPTSSSQAGAGSGGKGVGGGTTPKRKFSSFFKSLVIELDKDIYGPDNHLVEWHRTPQTSETDGFQVKRPGDRNVKCTILLLLDYQPMKYKLSLRLAKILGLHTETRPKIIEALWQYVKTHRLQDPNERDHINCDQYLEQIFNTRRMRFMEVPQRLQGLLSQPDPIIINHVITVEGSDPKKTACYDIDVEIEDPLKSQMSHFVNVLVPDRPPMPQSSQADVALLDSKIHETVEQLNEWRTRRDFFLSFSERPREFIQKWLVSQATDLKTITENESNPEAERRAEYFYQPALDEAVYRYFYNKVQQKRAEVEAGLGVRNN